MEESSTAVEGSLTQGGAVGVAKVTSNGFLDAGGADGGADGVFDDAFEGIQDGRDRDRIRDCAGDGQPTISAAMDQDDHASEGSSGQGGGEYVAWSRFLDADDGHAARGWVEATFPFDPAPAQAGMRAAVPQHLNDALAWVPPTADEDGGGSETCDSSSKPGAISPLTSPLAARLLTFDREPFRWHKCVRALPCKDARFLGRRGPLALSELTVAIRITLAVFLLTCNAKPVPAIIIGPSHRHRLTCKVVVLC